MSYSRSIWVICAEDRNEIGDHTFQILSKAKFLNSEGESIITAVCIGEFPSYLINSLYEFGADRVLQCQLNPKNRWNFTNILCQMIDMYKPELVLFPATDWGENSASVIATYMQAGLTAKCIDLSVNEKGAYEFTRAALSNSVMAKIMCVNTDMQMCTIKKNVFKARRRKILSLPITQQFIYTDFENEHQNFPVVLESVPMQNKKVVNLDKAKLIFGFGRGIGDVDTYHLLLKVAKKYGAEVACTRAVVEGGLAEKERQVGQSGISIAPCIYVAFGISGASQHMAGIVNAKKIIAVNKDKNAPIFSFSDIVIQDDCKMILEKMYESNC